jgi:hypothetical protein
VPAGETTDPVEEPRTAPDDPVEEITDPVEEPTTAPDEPVEEITDPVEEPTSAPAEDSTDPVEEPTVADEETTESTSVEYVCLPWSIAGSGSQPTIVNTCGLDSILWLLHFLETNAELLVMPLVDSHITKELRKELHDAATLEVTGGNEISQEDMHVQNWVERGGLFKECSDLLGAGHPNLSRMKCLKALSSNLEKADVSRKLKKFTWSELSGQILNAWSSTADWLQLAEMSLGYWYSTIQVCTVCKKTVNIEMPNRRLYLPVDDIHNHTIDDVASMIDGGLPLHYL